MSHGRQEPGARNHTAEGDLRAVPRGCAGRICAQHARESERDRQRSGCKLRRLPRWRTRGAGGRRSQVAHQPRQYSAHLRPLPRAEVSDGVERREHAAVYLLPGQRARASHGKRLNEGRCVHRLPRRARDSSRERRQVAHLQVQRAGDVRQVPRGYRNGIQWQHSRTGHCAGQWAIARVHGLPRDPLHSGTRQSQLAGGGAESFARHLRALPRGRAAVEGVRHSWEPRVDLYGQLSRAGLGGRLGGCGQLLELSRRAQHSAIERPAFDHQSRQSGRDLR